MRVTEYACGHEPGVVTSANVTVRFRSQASEAIAFGKLGAAGHSIVAFGAQEIDGGVVSTTVIVWLQEAALPQASVAVQVRVTE